MKLTGRQATDHINRPSASVGATLIYGADAMRVALKRQALVLSLIGKDGETEMRLTRMTGADLRKDTALAADALKAQGFFPGPRAVLIEDVTEALAKPILQTLEMWQPGDAHLVVTAGQLTPRSSLRKAFENGASWAAVAVYDAPPTREEIDDALRAAGAQVDRDGQAALFDLSKQLDPGDFRQTIEKLGLYAMGRTASAVDVAEIAPRSTEAEIDDILDAVAGGQPEAIGPALVKLTAQGTTPVSLCIGLMRHFQTLYRIVGHPGGASQGAQAARMPYPRRDIMVRQASHWGERRLEQGLSVLVETDLNLRSAGQTAPQMALVERAMIRLAMLGRPS